MPLGRQRLLQRFFNLHHCIATTRAKQKRTPTPPRKRLSRPMISIANGDKRRRTSTGIGKRRASASADRTAPLRMVTLLTTKNDLVVKTAAIRKIAKRKFPTNAASRPPQAPQRPPRASEGTSARPEMPYWKKEMPHRATFLANGGVFDHERAGAGQNRRHLQKKQLPISRGGPTAVPPARRLCRPGQSGPINSLARIEQSDSPSRTARQPRANGSSAFNPGRTVRQLGSNSSSAQINQFLTYALRTLTSIGARTAHAIKFIGKQTKRRKARGERYHERHKQNRELHDRPLSANAKAPIVCSPREFRERIKPFSTSAGKV